MLIKEALSILNAANLKIGELGIEVVDKEGSPGQPFVMNQLSRSVMLYDQLLKFIVLNDDSTAILGTIGDNDTYLNDLLIQLQDIAELNDLTLTSPITQIITNQRSSITVPIGGSQGDMIYHDGTDWVVLEKGDDGDVLVSTPTTVQWQSVVGNGIPTGGTTGQVLQKNSNTSYDVVWGDISLADLGVTADLAEVNKLDGMTATQVELNLLTGLTGGSLQSQLAGKVSTVLADGSVIIGNPSNVATAVDTNSVGDIIGDTTNGLQIKSGVIVNADINNSAAISRTKLASGSSYRIIVNDGSGVMSQANAITANRVIVSDSNGLPVASTRTTTQLGYLDATSSIQTQLNNRLTVSLSSVTQGDIVWYNGSNWVNLAVGTSGQVISTDGSSVMWSNSSAGALPAGGSINQYLRKIDGTDFNTEWHTFVLADVTNVSATATEVNKLSGVTVTTTEINRLSGITGNIQALLNAKLNNSLTYNSIFVGDAANVPVPLSVGSNGQVLTISSGAPSWVTPNPPGDVSGPVSSTDNAIVRFNGTGGDSIQDSGVLVDDSNNLIFPTGAAIQTSTTDTNTLLIQAYDVDGTAYTTFITLTAANTPTMDINNTATIGGDLIYRSLSGLSLAQPTGSEALQSIRVNAGATAWEYYTPGTGGGDVVGPVSSTDNAIMRWDGAGGDTAQDSGIIIDDSDNISGIVSMTVVTGGALRTGTTDTNTLLLQAYDVDGTSYTTFATLTAGNTPTMDLATGVTIGSSYIYRIGGTDISLADGGTGASLSDPGADRIMFWDDSAGVVTWLSVDSTLLITDTTLSSVFDAEAAQDAVGGILTNTTTINLTYNDGTPSITADVNDGSLALAKLSATGTASSSTFLKGNNTWSGIGNGKGTTGNGTAVDLGGTVTGSSVIAGSGVDTDGFQITFQNTAGDVAFLSFGNQVFVEATTAGSFEIISVGTSLGAGNSLPVLVFQDQTARFGSALYNNSGTYQYYLEAQTDTSDIGAMVFVDNRATKVGIQYDADYSAGFTARSLVDKGYVDSVVSLSFSNGLTKTGSNVTLGGTLTGNVSITGTQTQNVVFGSPTYANAINNFQVFADNNFSLVSGDIAGLTTSRASISLDAGGTLTIGRADASATNINQVLINSSGFNFSLGGTSRLILGTSNTTLNLGSDATGDIYYRNSSGFLTRLPVGTNGHVLTLASGLPSWAAASGGGIGGSTGAVDNAILRADGTGGSTLQSSGLVVDDSANVLVGSGLSGSERTYTADGSASNVALEFNSKGTSPISLQDNLWWFYNYGGAQVGFTLNNNGTIYGGFHGVSLTTNASQISLAGFTNSGATLPGDFLITAGGQTSTTARGAHMTVSSGPSGAATQPSGDTTIQSGDSTAGGNTPSGNVILRAGTPQGTGARGSVYVNYSGSEILRIDGINNNVTEAADFTLTEAHRGKVVHCTKAGTQTVTMPTGFLEGWNTILVAWGATTVIATSGTVVGKTATTAQYETLALNHSITSGTYLGI